MDTKSSKCLHLVEGGTNSSQDVNMAPMGKTSLGRVIHARKRQKTSFTNLETHGDGSGYVACDTCSSGVANEIVLAGIVPIGNILVGNNIGFQTRTKGGVWLDALHAVQWEAGSGTVSNTLQLARVLREAAAVERIVHPTIYRLAGGGLGHWLWKPWKRHKRARSPWGYALGSANQLLDFERIMANTRKDEVSVRVKDALGNIVKPRLLGVILPDFTEWALPYVLVEDDGQDSGDPRGGLVRVTHRSKLDLWE